ncbi:hypothetical protein BJY04DRAFT_196680 [Aspergillus karnatakaensis]|uniref:fungal specific transcription factor domain-containing protein n=1 Tax=Aspergillus karnatakaensis TaxID=1810916 RepID=UPI003CCE0A44
MSACSARVKTCQTCATAKIRCLRSSGGSICDRCLRLDKPCYFRPARLRQSWTKKETRLESLEKRVEQLLAGGQSQRSSSPQDEPTGDVIDKGLVTLDDAAALLDHFLQFMMPQFPYVVLPEHTTAGELRQRKPFLFLAILSVSVTDDRGLQRALHDELKTAIAERMVTKHVPPSLESIQGLLVTLAWGQHQIQQRSAPPDFSTYLHLAIGLMVELELDRPVELQRRCRRMSTFEIAVEARPAAVLRAEQRAALGCSLLSSCYGIITQRMCTFPPSPSLETFALELAQSPEFVGDHYLIHLLRLQQIFQEIDKTSGDHHVMDKGAANKQGVDVLQRKFRAFKAQLEDYMNQISPLLTDNNFLLSSQLHTARLYLCEVNLFDKIRNPQLSPSFRAEVLCHGLAAGRDHFDALEAMPLGMERRMSYPQWLQSGFNLILASKLAVMAVSDESLRHAYPQVKALCDTLNMPGVLKICVERQRHVQPTSSNQKTGFDFAGWLQWIQEWFRRHYFRAISQGTDTPSATGASSTSSVTSGSSRTAPSSMSPNPTSYPPQPVADFNTGGPGVCDHTLTLPVMSQEMFPWPSFPDMLLSDHPLAGWMDFGVVPM